MFKTLFYLAERLDTGMQELTNGNFTKHIYHFTVGRFGNFGPSKTYVRDTLFYVQRMRREEHFNLAFVTDILRMDIHFTISFREI